MANSCLNENFKTSEASTKSWMRTRNLIDRYLNILDTDGFRKANKKWSDHAKAEYGTDGMLFIEENNKALPNKEAFKKIDEQKDITYEQRTSDEQRIDTQEFELQRELLEQKLGLEIIYDTSLDVSATVKGKTVRVNPNMIFRDTLVHEIGHIIIDSIGGFENPMVRKGLNQLKGTSLYNEIQKKYADKPQEIRDKEVLATAIGKEGADIFGNRPDRISKWKRWLDLFFNKVKQLFGIQPSVAKTLAQEIIYHQPMLAKAKELYEHRGYSTDEDINALKDIIEDTKTRLAAEIDRFKKVEIEGYQNVIENLQKLIDRLTDAELEVGVRSYIEIANDRMKILENKVNKDDITFEELRQVNDYLGPYTNVGALIDKLNALNLENAEELFNKASDTVATIDRIERMYIKKIKIKTAEKMMTAENGTIHIRKRHAFREEFDEKNLEKGFFKDTPMLNGKKVSKAQYNKAQKQYVAQKMDQNREAIEQEEYEHLREVFERVSGDIGFFEAFAYETSNINDEILQIVTELINNADTQTRTSYYEKEREIYDLFQAYKESVDKLPADQKKRWDFLLADELDENGNPTGEKLDYIIRDNLNPSFVIQKRKLYDERDRLDEKVSDLYLKMQNDPSFREDYKQAKKERDDQYAKVKKWLNDNTIKYGGKYRPVDKWMVEQNLTKEQQDIKNAIEDLIEEIDDNYPPMGALTDMDKSTEMRTTKLPAINKTMTERVMEASFFDNMKQIWKDFYNPKTEDTQFQSMTQLDKDENDKVVAKTRDNKIHNHIPIPFRKDTDDQSYDVLSGFLFDYHASLNYKNKRGIEAEILGMLDIAKHREVAETRNSLGKGIQSIKNFFNEDRNVNKKDTSNLYNTLTKLIDARMYGVKRQGGDKINTIADNMISLSSLVIMPANVFSAVSNIVMGKTNSLIDMFGENLSTSGDLVRLGGLPLPITKADAEYMKYVPKTVSESWKPKKETKVNKIMEHYDVMGSFYGPSTRFAEDTWYKNMFNRGMLYVLQTMVEHYIHGTTAIGVLMSMKLQNKNGNYINKEGNKVEDAESAATMYDYLDLADGEIAFNGVPNAYKTDKFEAALETKELDQLIKNKIRDFVAQTQGQYDNNEFAVSELHIWGRMLFQLREWIPRSFERHWRGASYVFADEIPDHAKMTSRQSGEVKTGIQTQFAHTLAQSFKPFYRWLRGMQKEGEELSFDLMKQPWKELTTSERQNVRRAITTYGLAAIMSTSVYVLMNLDGDEDEIPDEMIYLIFALERAKQELLFFSNPMESLKILKSPAASVSTLRQFIGLTQQLSSDIINGEFERYQRGEEKGMPKARKDLIGLLPVFKQFDRDVRGALEYIQSIQTI